MGFLINPFRFGAPALWAGGGGSILDDDANYPKCTIRIPFEGANGSTSFLDAMGNAWTVNGNAQLTTTTPLVGASSLLLDGTGDWTDSVVASAVGTGDFTIRAKVRPASIASDGEIFCISDAPTTLTNFNIVCEWKTSGAIRFSIQAGSGGTVNADITSAGSVIAANTTYDIECCADGSTARVYVDGVQVASGAISGTRFNQQTTARIGRLSSSVTRDLNGRVDNVIVYAGVCLHPGGTSFTPDSAIPSMEIPRFTSRFTIGSSNASQGIATDGTHVWVSSSTTIYKYTMAGSLVTSRDVSGDNPTAKDQINGLFIRSGVLHVSCADFTAGVGTSWIADYDPDTLAYITHRQLTGDWFSEGLCWHEDSWWVCFHATKTLARYDASWNQTATYSLDFPITGTSGGFGSGQGYDGILWTGSLLWLSIHDSYDQDYWDVYYFDAGVMNEVARIARPTSMAHQGICLDPTDSTQVWAVERNAGGSDSAALFTFGP